MMDSPLAIDFVRSNRLTAPENPQAGTGNQTCFEKVLEWTVVSHSQTAAECVFGFYLRP
jgi:hypothetical protein